MAARYYRVFAVLFGVGLLALAWVIPAAGEPIIYPAKGQSIDVQHLDQDECRQWAATQSGVDPAAGAAASAPQPQPAPTPRQRRGRPALRGAAVGAAVGAVAGDTGKGAAIGAGAGVVGGAVRRKKTAAAQAAARQQSVAGPSQAAQEKYQRAFRACMEGKGYTVK